MRPVAAAFPAVAAFVLPTAGLASSAPGPCELVTRGHRAALHRTTPSGRESAYRLPQSAGRRCVYDAHEGSVLVVVPDAGSSFLQNNDLVDPFSGADA
jgi:hypothetical protein